jgi:hypothetical protein
MGIVMPHLNNIWNPSVESELPFQSPPKSHWHDDNQRGLSWSRTWPKQIEAGRETSHHGGESASPETFHVPGCGDDIDIIDI